MKVDKLVMKEAEEAWAKIPERRTGWIKELLVEVKRTKQAVKITELTSGQISGVHRKCKEEGYRCKTIEKGTGVLVLPPTKE